MLQYQSSSHSEQGEGTRGISTGKWIWGEHSQTISLILQVTQLKLNCESGITLYIIKKKQSCSLSYLFSFLFQFNLWSGFKKSDVGGVFIFHSVHVTAWHNRQKKKLKGIVYCLIHLEFLFSYNLSAIKCVFSFSFQACWLCVLVSVEVSFVLKKNKASTIYGIHFKWVSNAHTTLH